jgi:ketosteroid isomerase-like protein
MVRSFFLLAAAIASATNSTAEAAADLSTPEAASAAFYSALSTLDLAAMEAVWAKTDDATYFGPRSTSVTVGWDNVRAAWESSNSSFVSRTVTFGESHLTIDGNIAWEVGIETGYSQRIGEPPTGPNRNVAVNVYQWTGGRWLIVSHVVRGVAPPAATPVAVR